MDSTITVRLTCTIGVTSTKETLSFGMAMQIRNATLDFRSLNGELQNTNRDIGLVPLLSAAGKFERENNQWWGFDAAGSFAPIKYINGSNTDIVGAILDASVRGGFICNRAQMPL